jgi:predicted DNA-binding transcriptional regulator AlpA
MPTNDHATELLTQETLAVELKMRPQSLADWRHRGKGPDYIKVGQLVRYRRSDVQRWLDTRAVSHQETPQRRLDQEEHLAPNAPRLP